MIRHTSRRSRPDPVIQLVVSLWFTQVCYVLKPSMMEVVSDLVCTLWTKYEKENKQHCEQRVLRPPPRPPPQTPSSSPSSSVWQKSKSCRNLPVIVLRFLKNHTYLYRWNTKKARAMKAAGWLLLPA